MSLPSSQFETERAKLRESTRLKLRWNAILIFVMIAPGYSVFRQVTDVLSQGQIPGDLMLGITRLNLNGMVILYSIMAGFLVNIGYRWDVLRQQCAEQAYRIRELEQANTQRVG